LLEKNYISSILVQSMTKTIILLFLLFSSQFIVYAKSITDLENEGKQKNITRNWFIEAGGVYSSFQDIKFSDVQYSGFGAAIKLGLNREKENSYLWEAAFNFRYSSENASTHNNGKTTVIYPTIYFKYLRVLNDHFLIGGRVDLLDLDMRVLTNLQNNSTYYMASNLLYGSTIYKRSINSNWNFSASLDLALIGLSKESTSFAMNYNQTRIEKGEVDYQEETMGEPYPYKFWKFSHIGNHLNLITEFYFHYKTRLSAGYKWEMRHWATVPSYPTTIGAHSIVFRYNFAHKLK